MTTTKQQGTPPMDYTEYQAMRGTIAELRRRNTVLLEACRVALFTLGRGYVGNKSRKQAEAETIANLQAAIKAAEGGSDGV